MNNPIFLFAAIVLLAAIVKKPAEASGTPKTSDAIWRKAVADPAAAHLARPTPVQYDWQEQDRVMFVHFGLATWQEREYDDGSTPLSAIDPAHVDPDQWCRVAQSWGAKEIIFVAKHVGGFCWWPTETTDRCTRSIPWKHGTGDLVKDVAAACRRHGLKMGLYVYPDDPEYAGGINVSGRSGRTADPSKQAEWNAKYRTQWTEVLTRCGPDLVNEVWLDGSCVIPLGDIFQKYAPHAVVFQGEHASIRWAGNEEGHLSDPAWATLKSSDLKGGVATQEQDDPDGDAWAPLEADTTLYDHFWFWSAEHERTARKPLAKLVDCYTRSSGRGGLLLLDSSPNTDGRIPDADAAAYHALGAEIDRRFGHPLGVAEHVAGDTAEIDFRHPMSVGCSDLWEDYTYGQRIRGYVVEGWVADHWETLAAGTAVGRRKIDVFPAVMVSKLRVRVTQSVGTPLIRRLAAHAEGQTDGPQVSSAHTDTWQTVGTWSVPVGTDAQDIRTDLSTAVSVAGQYEIRLTEAGGAAFTISQAAPWFEGIKADTAFLTQTGSHTFLLNRTQAIGPASSSAFHAHITAPAGSSGVIQIRWKQSR
jgi:alpha-L-fucosidase